MKHLKYNTATRLNLILAALVLVLSVCIMIASAYARYENKLEDSELNMETATGSVYMYGDDNFTPLSAWTYNDVTGEYTVDIVISNAANAETFCAGDQRAALEIFLTLGLADPANICITLKVDNTEYTAVPIAVEKNSPSYIKCGDGWIFKFFDVAGEELNWTLRGGEVSSKMISLKIVGNTVEPTALSLILSGNMV